MTYHNILLVHHNSNPMDKLGRTLEHVGHKIEIVHSGEEALDFFTKEHPMLVIASDDIHNPDVFELCEQMKNSNGATPHGVKFLILSRRETLKSRQLAIKCGADEYLAESATLPSLVERINDFLKNGYTTEASDLSGSIAHTGLIDILQLIEFSAKNGVLSVTSGMRLGRMSFSDGRLVSAQTNDRQKEAAVYEMLSWEEGDFEFHNQPVEEKTNLAPISSLVLEWARAKDEGLPSPKTAPQIEGTARSHATNSEPQDQEDRDEKPDPENWASSLNAWLGYLREK